MATFSRGSVTVASVNAPLEADYEIGSVSKGITGLLYTDAVERGEVTPGSTLGEAIGPAGGIRSTIGDLAILVAALLDRSAPGIAALDPVRDFAPRTRIGAAWITIDLKGTAIAAAPD